MAGSKFGGVMRLRTANGTILALRGTFTLMPSRSSKEVVTNQDGSVDEVVTPIAPRADISFVDSDGAAQTLIDAPRQDITISEETTDVQHLFANGFFSGEPSVNRMNGETTGVQIVGEGYRRLG